MQQEIGVLYISYDGLSDSLGQSQIIPYLKKLATKNVKIVILSFEKKELAKNTYLLDEIGLELDRHSIKWYRLKYHKRPCFLATFYDVLCGYIRGLLLIYQYEPNIVHTRGYIPAFIAFFLKKTSGKKVVFDMRGFWVDEKVDSGFWNKESVGYKIAKALERKMLQFSDQILVLTENAKKVLTIKMGIHSDKIEVIPTCVDLKKFTPLKVSKQTFLQDKIVVLYSGSVGTFYGFKNAIDFFKILHEKEKKSFFLALINNRKEFAENLLKKSGIPSNSYKAMSLLYSEVADCLKEADISLIFYHRENSYAGCCPTKLGESLACGVPIIVNSDIGDCDDIVEHEKIGFVLKEFSNFEYHKVVAQCLISFKERETLRARCRCVAEKLFSLDNAIDIYLKVYNAGV